MGFTCDVKGSFASLCLEFDLFNHGLHMWCKRFICLFVFRSGWCLWASTHQRTSWEFYPLDLLGFLISWLNRCWPLLAFLAMTFSLVLFFPILRSPAQLHTTCFLGPTYQLRTNSPPSLTYLPIGFTLPFPPKLVTSFLPTFPPSLPPSYLLTQHLHSVN